MFRNITQYLTEWKSSPHRKPLILQGQDRLVRPIHFLSLDVNNMKMLLT